MSQRKAGWHAFPEPPNPPSEGKNFFFPLLLWLRLALPSRWVLQILIGWPSLGFVWGLNHKDWFRTLEDRWDSEDDCYANFAMTALLLHHARYLEMLNMNNQTSGHVILAIYVWEKDHNFSLKQGYHFLKSGKDQLSRLTTWNQWSVCENCCENCY